VSSEIKTILSWWSAEFCIIACGIRQNFPRKTVGPSDQ